MVKWELTSWIGHRSSCREVNRQQTSLRPVSLMRILMSGLFDINLPSFHGSILCDRTETCLIWPVIVYDEHAPLVRFFASFALLCRVCGNYWLLFFQIEGALLQLAWEISVWQECAERVSRRSKQTRCRETQGLDRREDQESINRHGKP